MVSIMSLWLPILVSAVIVFLASSVIHMFMSYHYSDFKKAPDEDKLLDALRNFNLAPGEYHAPRPSGRKEMMSEPFKARMAKGPSVLLTVWPSGPPQMGKTMGLWFVYTIIVGVFAAYIAGRALGPGVPYLSVFRFVGFTAFACYSVSGWSDSIWYQRSWRRTFWNTFDGLVYGLLTAGTFGWLWPQ